jgi:hypothetical protein
MHKRRTILKALQAQLKTLSGFSGVWIQRIGPSRNAYPGITLYAEEESVTTHVTGGYTADARDQDRILSVAINVWIKGTVDAEKTEETMDDAAERIEPIIVNDFDAIDLVLVATDFKVSEEEPEIHCLTLTYHVTYYAIERSPSTAP